MPLTGTRDLSSLNEAAPLLRSLEGEPLTLEGVEVLQLMYELDDSAMLSLLPPALHPTIPPTVTAVFWRARSSPWGPFELAQVRVGCRAGARPRALLLRAYCDNDAAREALADRWGFPTAPATVRLRHGYDRTVGTVVTEGHSILEAYLIDPEPISGGDLQYIANLNLARVPAAEGARLRLVQVDPEYVIHRAERGRPELRGLEPSAWALDGAVVDWPVSASYAFCDIELPRIRYLVDPAQPPLLAVERVERA